MQEELKYKLPDAQKNQKRCWNKIGSPPPEGSKKEELTFRSNNNIVIPPAKTGKANKSKKVVIEILQTNKENLSALSLFLRSKKIVTKKLIDLRIEETPAKWREKNN